MSPPGSPTWRVFLLSPSRLEIMKLLMKPPLRLCLGDELPSTDPRQCHGAMILPPRRHLWRGPGGVPAPCGWRRVPATTASNRPDLLHSFWRPGRRAAPWTPGGRSVRVPARAPRGRAARRGGGRGLTARVACGACRCTLRGAFYSARHSDPLRRAPGGRTGPRGRWSPPRPARRTGPVRSPDLRPWRAWPAGRRSGVLPSH